MATWRSGEAVLSGGGTKGGGTNQERPARLRGLIWLHNLTAEPSFSQELWEWLS